MERQIKDSSYTTGVACAVGAFVLWGVLPLYWIEAAHVPALEVVAHRVLWASICSWGIVAVRRQRSGTTFGTLLRADPGGVARLVGAGFFIATNWLTYVWAVTNGRTFDASLGYYINPLLSVVLGMVVLRERLSRLQWAAVACATTGVLYLTIRLGVVPWVSLILACSFAVYGLIKKKTKFAPFEAMAVETSLLALVSAAAILTIGIRGNGTFLAGDTPTTLVLLGGGPVTLAPLVLFAAGARRIRLADIGFIQYLGPTIMFIIALVVFRDPLEPERLTGFVFVWVALVLYAISRRRELQRSSTAPRRALRK